MKLSELHYIQLLDEARQEILTKGNNTVHYLKEIESRLSAGEEAVKEVERLKTDKRELVDALENVYAWSCSLSAWVEKVIAKHKEAL
jgi:uncharacterized protein YdeI (YjbR/CyaY-like superfamily)